MEQLELSFSARCDAKLYSHFENQYGIIHQIKYILTTWSGQSTLGYLPKINENICPHKTSMWTSIGALFIIALNWKQLKQIRSGLGLGPGVRGVNWTQSMNWIQRQIANMCVLAGPLIAVVKNHSAPLDIVSMANGKGNKQPSVVVFQGIPVDRLVSQALITCFMFVPLSTLLSWIKSQFIYNLHITKRNENPARLASPPLR